MNNKPSKDSNVLTNLEKYEDTWSPKQSDEPFMAVIKADMFFSLSSSEKELVVDYFSRTRKLKVEKLNNELLGVKDFKGAYMALYRLTKKGMFKFNTKDSEVLLTPNIVSPRTPLKRIDSKVIEESNLTVHPYTGAITNGDYYIHYDVLNVINDYGARHLRILRYLLTNMDSTTNSVSLHISKTAKELKVRVSEIREVLTMLHEEKKLVFISDNLVTTIQPSKTYLIMLNPKWFIKSFSNYISFRYSFNFFIKVINDGYPINYGVFSNYVSDSVKAVKEVKSRYNKNNKIVKKQKTDSFNKLLKGETLDIEFIETDFITIKEEYINENY